MSKLNFCAIALAALFSGSVMAQAASQPAGPKTRDEVKAELAKSRTTDPAKPGAADPATLVGTEVTPAKAKKIKGKAAKKKADAASAAAH